MISGARRILRLGASVLLAPAVMLLLARSLVALSELVTGDVADSREWIAAAVGATLIAAAAGLGWDRLRHVPRNLAVEHVVLTLFAGFAFTAVLRMPLEHAAGSNCVKAKATLGQIRTLAAALQAHREASGAFPATGADASALASALAPTHVRVVPLRDLWRRPLAFDVSANAWRVESSGPGGRHPLALDSDGRITWPAFRRCPCPQAPAAH